jgi:cysteine desulfurase
MGVYSIRLALEELRRTFSFDKLNAATRYVESKLKSYLSTDIIIVGEQSKYRNGNTIFFILKNRKIDNFLIGLDMNGVEVGTGSACASGGRNPSKIIIAYGFSEDEARSAVRLSFSPSFSMDEAINGVEKLIRQLKATS